MTGRHERCSPVPLWLQELIPKGSYRMFMFAASDGRTMNPRGTYDRLRQNERPVGVRVSKVHRDRTLERLGLGLRSWQVATKTWETIGFAHRCKHERVFLFLVHPKEGVCPDCKTKCWFAPERSATSLGTKPEFAEHVGNGEPLYGNPVRGNPWGSGSKAPTGSEGSRIKGSKASANSPPRTSDEAWDLIDGGDADVVDL